MLYIDASSGFYKQFGSYQRGLTLSDTYWDSTSAVITKSELMSIHKIENLNLYRKDGIGLFFDEPISIETFIPILEDFESIDGKKLIDIKKINVEIKHSYQLYDVFLNDPRFMVFNNGVVVNIIFAINNYNYICRYREDEYYDSYEGVMNSFIETELWLYDSIISNDYTFNRPIFPCNAGFDQYLCEISYDTLQNRKDIYLTDDISVNTNTYEVLNYPQYILPQRGSCNIARQGFSSSEHPPFCNELDHYKNPDCKTNYKIILYYGCRLRVHSLVYKKVKNQFKTSNYPIHRIFHRPNYSSAKSLYPLYYPVIHKNGDTWDNSIDNLCGIEYFPETRHHLWKNGYFFWIEPDKIPEFLIEKIKYFFWNTPCDSVFPEFEPDISSSVPKLFKWDSTSVPPCFE